MRTFLGYMRKKALLILVLALCAACLVLVNWLEGISLHGTIYALILCTVFIIIVGIIDFVKYYTFTKQLKEMKNRILIDIDELPKPIDPLTSQYTELIKMLSDAKLEADHINLSRYRDLVDYYTTWAHQIKTPIQAMRLILQTESQNIDLELELLRIEQYVDMVLSYLKLDGNSNDLALKRQDIDPIIKAAVKKNAKSFIAKKISLEYEDVDIKALTDEKWLQFIVEQILSNSLKYTQKGSVSIYKVSDTSFAIKDTGIGIAKDDLPRVFERGFTGYNGREDKKATGIGLYLASELIKKLGHTIEIDSEVGAGTTVTIDLYIDALDARD